MPDSFRVTSVGKYHLTRWSSVFTYFDAMVFDTPIFDTEIKMVLTEELESFDIEHRYIRAIEFRKYLKKCWNELLQKPIYFDFAEQIQDGERSFKSVKNVIEANNLP